MGLMFIVILRPPYSRAPVTILQLSGPQGRSGRVRKISTPPGFEHRVIQPVASCYTGYVTYLLTPLSRALLEKLTGSAASQEIPRNFWNPKVHHLTHKCPPPVPILSQLHPVPTNPSHFLKIQINIILPSTSGSPQWSLSLRFSHQNPVHPSLLHHTCHMPRPSHYLSYR